MRIPFSVLFAILLSFETFAAPLPTVDAGNEFALEVRAKLKVAPKKAPVRAKAPAKPKPIKKTPVAKAKPLPKKVAPKPGKPAAKKKVIVPAKKPAAKAPVAKRPINAAKPAAKSPGKPAGKKVVPPKKPVAKGTVKPATKGAIKPVAKGKTPVKAATKPKAAAASCAIKPGATSPIASKAKATAAKAKKTGKRMMDQMNVFARKAVIARRTLFGLIQPRLTEGNEFIGWHGTNKETADLWEGSGEIVRPQTKEGQTKGRSGLDAELGAGLYISDTLSVAEAAAAINAQANNLPGKVCAIFAKSSVNWREARDKVQIPEILRGNAATKEKARQSYITDLPGRTGRTPSILFGPLRGTANQLMIVERLNPNFEAQCFDINAAGDSIGAQNSGNAVSYIDPVIIRDWSIRKENVELAQGTLAIIEGTACPRPTVQASGST
ncbi:hypothetical protein DFH09DRAFT_581000 [Mycena vulgaris]|nr:hypothetical protein DFH09DRAFT_581000 [Mycena vulgaris]